MPNQTILVLAVVALSCGSAALLVVRLHNPMLQGLGWLAGAFISGGLGAALMLSTHAPPSLNVWLADFLIVLAFVLFHSSSEELTGHKVRLPILGIVLLAMVGTTSTLAALHWMDAHLRISFISLAVGVQTTRTAFMLLAFSRTGIKVPARFTAGVLLAFALFNFVRSGLEAGGLLADQSLWVSSVTVSFAVFVAAGLGMAFSFFWMSTALLTASLELVASTDPLTRVYNRRVFLDWCTRELAQSVRAGTPCSVLMVDLDHFKSINDTFGHAAGDEILCAAVRQIQHSVRGIDMVCRWGGEEFAALLPGASHAAAYLVAERIRQNMARVELPLFARDKLDGRSFRLTASIGTATVKGSDDTITALLDRADRALYQAKSTGRNRVLSLDAEPARSLASA